IASAGNDQHVRVWESDTGAARIAFSPFKGPIHTLVFHPDSRNVLAGGADPNVGKLLAVADGSERQVYEAHSPPATPAPITPAAPLPPGASAGAPATPAPPTNPPAPSPGPTSRPPRGPTEGAPAVASTPDGPRLASGSNDLSARIWELGSTEPMRLLGGEEGA